MTDPKDGGGKGAPRMTKRLPCPLGEEQRVGGRMLARTSAAGVPFPGEEAADILVGKQLA